uniref:Uncharacterized protein n=1 Tax=Romanomermis culicivorax TaxID=13658 RepID=A0A915I8C1_ROMCU
RLRQKQRSRGATESHFRSIAAAPTSHSSTPPPYTSNNGQLFSNSQQSIPTPATPNIIQRPFSAIPFNLAPGSSPRDKFLASFSNNNLCPNNNDISSVTNNSSSPSGGSLSSYFDQSMFGINCGGTDSLFLGLSGSKLFKTPISGGHSVDSSSSPNSSSTPGSSNNNREFGVASSSGYGGAFSDPTLSPTSTTDIATTLFGLPPIRRQNQNT